MQKQSLVVKELRRQCDESFSEFFSELLAQTDTTEKPAEHKLKRERQLKQDYQQKVTELSKAIDKSNDLLYECSGVRRSESCSRTVTGLGDKRTPLTTKQPGEKKKD